ncbi:carbonic anhydrase [Sphingobium sp.]|uniref:carbonic anhydrase n=1 Tax=Sphingobium sp. TaxID=1912891 RepID=UPI0028BF0E9B|nr:carbonic anhydrase [Sphingobium sp.]
MIDFADMLSGYRRFRNTGWTEQRERWDDLSEGQSPRVMVIACSDSRVDPAQIFDTSPGEVFVVRNVAALVPPFETNPGRHGVSAALEFAVQVLKVGEIVVMGHGKCGGCKAALSQALKDAPPGEGGFIHNWIELLDDAREKVVERFGDDRSRDAERAMEQEGVKVSLANLRTFPCVRAKERDGEIKLIGAFFAIADGQLHLLDEESGEFHPAPLEA